MRAFVPLALLTAAAMVACSSDTSPLSTSTNTTDTTHTTTTNTTVDLNARVNELLAEINSSEAAISAGGGGGVSGEVVVGGAVRLAVLPTRAMTPSLSSAPPDNAAACTFDSTKVVYTCPANTLSTGLVHQASFQFVDTTGKPQAHFDTLSTGGIIRWTTLKGTISQPVQTQNGPVPATQITNNRDSIVLGGIRAGQQHAQNGGGSLVQTIIEQGVADTAFITAPTTTTGIQTSSKVPYPVAGSYTAVVHTVQGTSTSTTNQVTTFNGTSTATLVITFPNGTHRTCTYDMTSTAAPVCTGP